MENTTNPPQLEKVSYSLHDKFITVLPEWRIRRYQYFARSLTIGVVLYLIIFSLFGMLWGNIFGFKWLFYGTIISSFLFQIFQYFPIKTLIRKRCRDIGRNGNLEVGVYTTSIIVWLVNYLLLILLFFFGIEVSSFLSGILTLISWPLYMVAGFVWLVCLLQPGKKWDNEFGSDPINTKVTFLG